MDVDLGTIKSVDLRNIWRKEDRHFTPWLSENIEILAEKLGIEIIDVRTEEEIGNFKLDIIGKDANSNRFVAIENQLETTNHNHLGQLITYSAGIDAAIIIWIAKEIREEHKNALEWLNENSLSDISFFGVEISAIAIDDSNPAVDFKPVVKPNNWERELKTSASKSLTETEQNYHEFYSKLIDEYSSIDKSFKKIKVYPQSWMQYGAGKTGLSFGWAFRMGNRFSVELYIDTGDKDTNQDIFEEFKNKKNEIDSRIKGVEWESLETKRACRIVIYKSQSAPIKSLQEDEKGELLEWGRDTMKQFKNTFSNYINGLN